MQYLTRVLNRKFALTAILQVAMLINWTVPTWAAWGYIDEKQHKTIYPDHAYINQAGGIVVKCPSRTDCAEFSNGLAQVKAEENKSAPGDLCSFIDHSGKVCISGFNLSSSFSEGLAMAGKPDRVGFIDKSGRFVIPARFEEAENFREGLAPVMTNHRIGFIDKSGELVIDPFYDNVAQFSEGLAAAESEGKIGFITPTGTWQIKPKYDYVSGFSDGLALVQSDEEECYIDDHGTVVIRLDPIHNKRLLACEEVSFVGLRATKGFFGGGLNSHIFGSNCVFREGLAAICVDGKYGFIDKTGKLVIPAQFDCAFPFSEQMAKVMVGGKYGFIDKSGKLVIEPKFFTARSFKEGAAAVAVTKDQWGFIDPSGKYLVQPKFPYAWSFAEGLAEVQLWGCPP